MIQLQNELQFAVSRQILEKLREQGLLSDAEYDAALCFLARIYTPFAV